MWTVVGVAKGWEVLAVGRAGTTVSEQVRRAEGEPGTVRTRRTIEPRFTLTMKRSLPGPVAIISDEREGV